MNYLLLIPAVMCFGFSDWFFLNYVLRNKSKIFRTDISEADRRAASVSFAGVLSFLFVVFVWMALTFIFGE